jgi:hypothetical protein
MKKFRNEFLLYKLGDDRHLLADTDPTWRDRPYYFRFMFRGKRYPRCLDTNDAAEAQRRAREIYQQIRADANAAAELKMRQPAPAKPATITQIIAAYKTGPSAAGADTRRRNCGSFRLIVPLPADNVTDITAAAARSLFARATQRAMAAPDQGKSNSIKRTAMATWRAARSLFTPVCIDDYKAKGLYHACIDEFLAAGDLARFKKLPKITYVLPADGLIERTLTEWQKLSDRNLFLAVGFELIFGLRAKETAQAKWNWLQRKYGSPMLLARGFFKNRAFEFEAPALDPWFTIMSKRIIAEKWAGQPDDFVIQGSKTFRGDENFRDVSAWMRGLGWQTQKTNHALRAWAGCQVAVKYDLWEACRFLRHSSVQVTEGHYMYLLKGPHIAWMREHCIARWATFEAKQAKTKKKITRKDATLDATSRALDLTSTDLQRQNLIYAPVR